MYTVQGDQSLQESEKLKERMRDEEHYEQFFLPPNLLITELCLVIDSAITSTLLSKVHGADQKTADAVYILCSGISYYKNRKN